MDNMRDMITKGRAVHTDTPRGAAHALAKLTDDSVARIRVMASDGIRHSAIARTFGVSQTLILNIVRRRTWAHVA